MDQFNITKPSDISELWWSEVCKNIKGSAVFVDKYVAEALHYNGGLQRLKNSKCKSIQEFSSSQFSGEGVNAVFLISTPLVGGNLLILKDIITNSEFTSVKVISGCHSYVHSYVYHGEDVSFSEGNINSKLENNIRRWMRNEDSTVEILCLPLMLIPLLPNVFLLPIFKEVCLRNMKVLNEADRRKFIQSLDDLNFQHLPPRLQASVHHLVVILHSFLQGMCAREELYSIGHMARIVSDRLESFSPARQRRKTATHKVSVIFVDRDLDLVAPTNLSDSTFMSKILNVLERLPGHHVDSKVDMSPLTSVHSSCKEAILPGSFINPSARETQDVLGLSVYGTRKQMVGKLNYELAALLDATEKESAFDHSCYDSLDLLEQNIFKVAEKKENLIQHFHLIQQGLCVLQCSKHQRNDELNRLLCLQKTFLQSFNELSPEDNSIAQQLLLLLKTHEAKGVHLVDIICLFLHVASLVGPSALKGVSKRAFTEALTHALKKGIADGDSKLLNTLGESLSEDDCQVVAESVWVQLICVSTAKNHLKNYRNLYGRNSDSEPHVYNDLLSQVVSDIIDPPSESITDLEYRSAGFRDIIKTGFSLFVNVARPRPKDAALVLIYVLGGITPLEIRNVKCIVDRVSPECEILLGSSHLTFADDIVHQYLSKE